MTVRPPLHAIVIAGLDPAIHGSTGGSDVVNTGAMSR
jgi:hypothetical protein